LNIQTMYLQINNAHYWHDSSYRTINVINIGEN